MSGGRGTKSFVNNAGICKSRKMTAPAGHVGSDMLVDVGRHDLVQGINARPGKAFCGSKKRYRI